MRNLVWLAMMFLPLSLSGSAVADDTAIGAKLDMLGNKLDAIERRLAHIEAMEQARGPKTPFTASILGPMSDSNASTLCRRLGYAGHMVGSMPNSSPGNSNGVTLICF